MTCPYGFLTADGCSLGHPGCRCADDHARLDSTSTGEAGIQRVLLDLAREMERAASAEADTEWASGARWAATRLRAEAKKLPDADSLPDVVSALAVLGLNGDKIFERIRDDLERGDIRGARTHLNFVDEMLEYGRLLQRFVRRG